LLCLFVGRCRDSDFSPPCSDSAVRLAISDWDCNGSITPVDASITLGIFVGRLRVEDTPLSRGCSSGGQAAGSFQKRAFVLEDLPEEKPLEIEVGDASGAPGDVVMVEVRTRQEVALGSTDLVLRYDRRVLEALWAESTTLSGFTFGIDSTRGLVRTASATGEVDLVAAGAPLFRVAFRVVGQGRRVSSLRLRDGDGIGRPDLAGPALKGRAPRSIPFVAHSGRFRLQAW
jgi:hypothetical protein